MRSSRSRILAADPVARRGGRAAALVAEPVDLVAVVARDPDEVGRAAAVAADLVRAAAVDLVAGDLLPNRLLPIRFR